ncbi:MAG TPA: alpha/beta hydrolase [Polyangiales bacterium]|nr:alpha/beta hydrolase [Polyangiales bacterium]
MPRRRRWPKILLWPLLAYAALIGIVMAFEDRMIYFPARGGRVHGPGEDVTLRAADGVLLHARYIAKRPSDPTLLYLHGNAGNLAGRSEVLQYFASFGANLLAVDYRGYGQSDGVPSEAGLYADARAAWSFLRERTPSSRIVVLGESLGGGPACELAVSEPVAGLILLAAFTSVADMAQYYYPWLPTRWMVRTRFDNLDKIGRVRAPKLFVHSRTDEVIPFEMGQRLFAAAAEPKAAVWLEHSGHNDMFVMDEAPLGAAIRAFLQRTAAAD